MPKDILDTKQEMTELFLDNIIHCLSELESQVCLVMEKQRYFYHINSTMHYEYTWSPMS